MALGLDRRGLNSECVPGQFAVVLCGFTHSVNSVVLYLLVMATCSIKRRARSGVWFGGNMVKAWQRWKLMRLGAACTLMSAHQLHAKQTCVIHSLTDHTFR